MARRRHPYLSDIRALAFPFRDDFLSFVTVVPACPPSRPPARTALLLLLHSPPVPLYLFTRHRCHTNLLPLNWVLLAFTSSATKRKESDEKQYYNAQRRRVTFTSGLTASRSE